MSHTDIALVVLELYLLRQRLLWTLHCAYFRRYNSARASLPAALKNT